MLQRSAMEELKLEEVYDVVYTSFWQTLPGYGILIILGIFVGIAGYFIFQAVQNYRNGTDKDTALRILRSLAAKVEKGSLEHQKIYQELTTCIKRYAQWRYDIQRGVTDYELVSSLTRIPLQESQIKKIDRIISDSQAIKFGRHSASKEQLLTDIADAQEFITVAGDRTT